MSCRIIAVCDLCGAEQPMINGDLIPEVAFDAILVAHGWRVREDAIRHVCPAHPAPLT